MRHISFALTTDSFIDETKSVTRRLGWNASTTPAGTHLMGVEKQQGLKKGEKVNRLGEIVVLKNTFEPLEDIALKQIRDEPEFGFTHRRYITEVEREGFPAWKMTPWKYVEFFCKANSTSKRKVTPKSFVNRLVFGHYHVSQEGIRYVTIKTPGGILAILEMLETDS